MSTFASKLKRNSKNILSGVMLAAALGAAGAVQAEVLTFEQPIDSPVLIDSTETVFGNFWIDTFTGANDGAGLAGLVIDGSDNGLCSLNCPINNSTNYLSILDDSYFYFGLNSGADMRVKSLQASFIGNGQTAFGSPAGVLVITGYSATGTLLATANQVALAAPNAAGQFNFATYDLGAFADTAVSFVRVLGYACDITGSCSRATGLSNFAVDNITTLEATVPEPSSIALFGLAAAGLLAARRRRAA